MELFTEGKDYVTTLPQGCVYAEQSDIIKDGEIIKGRWIVVKSFYTNNYEKYRLSGNNLKELLTFLKHKRIFIKK